MRTSLKTSLLVAAMAALCLAQTAGDLESPAVLRVADKLKCSCGCNLTMACKMEGDCQICRRGKTKIFTMQQQGQSDDQILASFVQESGKDILVQRPGIMGAGGVVAAALIGLAMVVLVMRRYMRQKPSAAVANAPEIDPETLARIEKDLSKLD
ncbi:MAG TPA: cytochrome c-type biogenesis protein CcmH [Bryobacteraceae bacterium]|nr:cytochrome c-type biogenesis protein CcmH [Bryobacteraceae bacterium]